MTSLTKLFGLFFNSYARCTILLACCMSPVWVSADEKIVQKMEFRWQFLRVGTMDFEIGPDFYSEASPKAGEFGSPLFANNSTLGESSLNSEGDVYRPPTHLAVTGATFGPLRWFKNYRARAALEVGLEARRFSLVGQDNGADEKRVLVFAAGDSPMVEYFKDSSQQRPLRPQDAWALNTVDPLTVFEWMIFSAIQRQSCENQFWIYDGKRRYAARTSDLTNNYLLGDTKFENLSAKCRLTLVGASSGLEQSSLPQSLSNLQPNTEQSNVKMQEGALGFEQEKTKVRSIWGSFWPFGTADRNIDFLFRLCSPSRLLVTEVEMRAPFGKVLGRSVEKC